MLAPESRSSRVVLAARWTNLVLATYEIPERLLQPYIHPALELDRWEGRCHVSLVAFDFQDTRVLGWPVPGFANFPEVNLRTYVKYENQRGVVFIRELVPHWPTAAIARLWYNEPYRSVPMSSQTTTMAHELRTTRQWRAGGRLHRVDVSASTSSSMPSADSLEHHFKEHKWGFGRSRRGDLLRYRVEHPTWPIHPITSSHITVGFAASYGDAWTALDEREPSSLILATGSPIKVFEPVNLTKRI